MVDAAAACCAAMSSNQITQAQARAIMLSMKAGNSLNEALSEVGVTPDELLSLGKHRIRLWKWSPGSPLEKTSVGKDSAPHAVPGNSFEAEDSPALDEAMQIGGASDSPVPMMLEDFEAEEAESAQNVDDFEVTRDELVFLPELEHDFTPRKHGEVLIDSPMQVGVGENSDVFDGGVVELSTPSSTDTADSVVDFVDSENSLEPERDADSSQSEGASDSGSFEAPAPGGKGVFANMMAKWKSKVSGISKNRREPMTSSTHIDEPEGESQQLFDTMETQNSEPQLVACENEPKVATAEELWLAEVNNACAVSAESTESEREGAEIETSAIDVKKTGEHAVRELEHRIEEESESFSSRPDNAVDESGLEKPVYSELFPSAMSQFMEQVSELEDITDDDDFEDFLSASRPVDESLTHSGTSSARLQSGASSITDSYDSGLHSISASNDSDFPSAGSSYSADLSSVGASYDLAEKLNPSDSESPEKVEMVRPARIRISRTIRLTPMKRVLSPLQEIRARLPMRIILVLKVGNWQRRRMLLPHLSLNSMR